VPTDRLQVVDDVADGLDAAVAGGEGPLYVLPTYTALLELRRELVALPTYTAMLALRELLVARGAAKGSFG